MHALDVVYSTADEVRRKKRQPIFITDGLLTELLARIEGERDYLSTNVKLLSGMRCAFEPTFLLVAEALIEDWRWLLKYYRKNTLPHLLVLEEHIATDIPAG